jgi:integrase
VIFSPPVIDRFTSQGMPQYTKAGRNTMRSRLRRMADVLLGDEREPDRERPMGNSDAVRPYSQAEIAALYSWANGQSDGERYSSAMTLLALGLGAGLTGSEIARLKIGHIHVDDEGVVVQVGGTRPREVPVLREWEQMLVERVAGREAGSWAFREGQEGGNRNLVTDFAARSRGEVGLQARRMRATWIVHLLSREVGLIPLLEASGLRSVEAIDKFLPFVPRDAEDQKRRMLRGPGTVKLKSGD